MANKFKPTNEQIATFLKEFGLTQREVKQIEGFKGSNSDISEMAINFGYVWIEKYKKWINKDNSCYTDFDELIVDYLRG